LHYLSILTDSIKNSRWLLEIAKLRKFMPAFSEGTRIYIAFQLDKILKGGTPVRYL
jgi:hypothetical protein